MDNVIRMPFTNMVIRQEAGRLSSVQWSCFFLLSMRWTKDQTSIRQAIIKKRSPAQAGAMMNRREWFI